MMLNVLKLLKDQSAQNRADFAQAQADRAEAAATKPKQWTAQGRDADSGKMALSADGDAPRLIGDRITSGDIQRGQGVRVNAANGTVTVDQKPSKQRQTEPETPQAEVKPFWVAFGNGFAVSFDAEATSFTESDYPEYEEYPASAQGSVMFPYGRISGFAAASLDLWVVGGFLDYDRANPPPESLRLSFAASTDQGATWQLCEQFVPFVVGSNANWAYSLVWGEGYFFAIVALTEIYRSEDGLVWELISTVPAPFQITFGAAVQQALAVWDGTVYLLQALTAFNQSGTFYGLQETVVHTYAENLQGQPRFALAKRFSFAESVQYGAYWSYGDRVHLSSRDWLTFSEGLYPFLLSADLEGLAGYGDAHYEPGLANLNRLLLLHFNGGSQGQVICPGDNIDGQVFLMAAPDYGFRAGDQASPYGFVAIYEGDSWRTCEHPFLGKLAGNQIIQSVTYSADLQQWLIYQGQAYVSLSGINGDDWNEPFQPELTTAIERPSTTLAAIANQVRAFKVAGNYVS